MGAWLLARCAWLQARCGSMGAWLLARYGYNGRIGAWLLARCGRRWVRVVCMIALRVVYWTVMWLLALSLVPVATWVAWAFGQVVV